MNNLLLMPILAAALTCCSAPSMGAEPRKQNPEIPHAQAPLTVVELFEMREADIDRFVAGYAERSQVAGKEAGFIAAVLYQSLLPDHPYRLIAVEQWQNYDAWANRGTDSAAGPDDARSKTTRALYRPAAYYTHLYGQTEQITPEKPDAGTPLRVPPDPAIADPAAPFVFINLMAMDGKDVEQFIADWKVRSQLTARQIGTITATLYKNIFPDSRYPIINISQYQSYNAYIDNQNDPTYTRNLERELQQASSIRLVRGFFRPVAAYTHLYD